MSKIQVKNPIVEMDGDEMTRIIWQMIKDKLITPYIDLTLDYYDLHVKHRDDTDDKVTFDAANAIKKHKVGVKCATITANSQRVKEYKLRRALPSPNATIRGILDGTVFRKPIIIEGINPAVRSWSKPITIGRHAYGDIYKATELVVDQPGKLELVFTGNDGKESRQTVFDYDGPGVAMAMFNVERSIRSFATSCLNFACDQGINLWFATKDTISKKYHTRFKEIFAETVKQHEDKIKNAGIEYRYLLIDDAAAQIMKHEGGMLLALMNYDGDVWSDCIAGGFGSLGLMTSVLVSPDGNFEYEAAHGTVTRHYYRHQKGEATSTNSIASIFAWSGALRKRGELDQNQELIKFADKLEESIYTITAKGILTKDMIMMKGGDISEAQTTESFIEEVAKELEKSI